jgi:hypothetical protein
LWKGRKNPQRKEFKHIQPENKTGDGMSLFSEAKPKQARAGDMGPFHKRMRNIAIGTGAFVTLVIGAVGVFSRAGNKEISPRPAWDDQNAAARRKNAAKVIAVSAATAAAGFFACKHLTDMAKSSD